MMSSRRPLQDDDEPATSPPVPRLSWLRNKDATSGGDGPELMPIDKPAPTIIDNDEKKELAKKSDRHDARVVLQQSASAMHGNGARQSWLEHKHASEVHKYGAGTSWVGRKRSEKNSGDDTRPPPKGEKELGPLHLFDSTSPQENEPQSQREALPTAMLVSANQHEQPGTTFAHRDEEGGGASIPIAVQAKWYDYFKRKRVRIGLLLAVILVGGVIGIVVYAVRTGNSDSNDSSSSSAGPPTLAPNVPTSAPTTLVLEQLGQTLIHEGNDLPVDFGPRGVLYFGWAVDLSSDGTRLIVGAPYHQRVFIYDFDSTEGLWVLTGEIQEDSGLVDHIVLSGDGTALAVGVPRNSDIHANGGKVQVYAVNLSGLWEPMGDPIYGQGPGDLIGGFTDDDLFPGDTDYNDDDYQQLSLDSYDSSSMALSENGQVLAIGSPRGNYVLVFSFDTATSQWTRLGSNTDFVGETPGDKFGTTVDLSADGHRMVVGAPDSLGRADPTWDIYTGHVRVFQYQGAQEDSWIKLGQDIEGERTAGDAALVPGTEGEQAGSVVSISADGTTIAVGSNFQASSEDIYALGDRDGHVKVYRYAESRDEWVQVGNTINIFQFGLVLRDDFESQQMLNAGLNSEKFPVVSRLSRDGNRMAISALAESLDGDITGRGVVRLYELRGETWKAIGTAIEGVSEFDHSGRSISLSFDGSRLAVGAPQHNANGLDDGQVRVFMLEGTASIPTASPSTPPPTSSPGPLVPITILLTLDTDTERLAWSLECGGTLVTNVTAETYDSPEFVQANVTETFQIPDGSVCTMALSSFGHLDRYKVFYGAGVSDGNLVLVDSTKLDGEFQRDISFYVSPGTTSLSVTVQLDAFPHETGLGLFCDGYAFLSIPLGGFFFEEPFSFLNVTVMGVVEGAMCEFVITDAFGDGICCTNGVGYYTINYGGPTGSLLVAGGRFDSLESVNFFVSTSEDPITLAPTTSPNSRPTVTPSPTGDFVVVTVVIQLSDDPQAVRWSLECNNDMLENVLFGTYTEEDALIVAPITVGAGQTCEFIIATPGGGGLGFDSYYKLFFGQNITDETNLIAQGSSFRKRDLVTFVAMPPL